MKTGDVTAAIIAAANQVGVHIHDLDRLHQQVHASWKRTVVADYKAAVELVESTTSATTWRALDMVNAIAQRLDVPLRPFAPHKDPVPAGRLDLERAESGEPEQLTLFPDYGPATRELVVFGDEDGRLFVIGTHDIAVAEAVLRTRGYGDYEIDPRELSHRAWWGRWVVPDDPSYAAQVDQCEWHHPDAQPCLTID